MCPWVCHCGPCSLWLNGFQILIETLFDRCSSCPLNVPFEGSEKSSRTFVCGSFPSRQSVVGMVLRWEKVGNGLVFDISKDFAGQLKGLVQL